MKINVAFIKELMQVHNWTLGQLEIKSGISKAHLSRILSGKRGVGLKSIDGFMRAFPEARDDPFFLTNLLPNGNRCEGGELNE